MNDTFDSASGDGDLLKLAGARTVQQGIAFFDTVGMPSRNLSARTRIEYHNDLVDFARFLEQRGKRELRLIGLSDLESYQADMDGRGFAPASRRRKTHTLKAFFSFLSNQGVVVTNIADRLIPPRSPRQEPRWLSEREYKDLLRACSHHPRDAALVELFLQTGMRLSELAGLTLTDIELPTKPTPEPENVGFARVRRKGGQMSQIPLNYKACKALKAWTALRPVCGHESLFVSKYATPMSRRAIQAPPVPTLPETDAPDNLDSNEAEKRDRQDVAGTGERAVGEREGGRTAARPGGGAKGEAAAVHCGLQAGNRPRGRQV